MSDDKDEANGLTIFFGVIFVVAFFAAMPWVLNAGVKYLDFVSSFF